MIFVCFCHIIPTKLYRSAAKIAKCLWRSGMSRPHSQNITEELQSSKQCFLGFLHLAESQEFTLTMWDSETIVLRVGWYMWFSNVFRLVFAWKASILTPTSQFWHWHHPLFHAASGTITLRTFCLHHGFAIFVNLQVFYNSNELHVSYCFLLPYTSFSNMWLHYGAYWIVICCNKVENHTTHDSVNFAGAHKNLTSLSKTLFLALVLDSWVEESTHHVTCLHTHGIASHTWFHMPCQSRASLSPRETRSNNVKQVGSQAFLVDPSWKQETPMSRTQEQRVWHSTQLKGRVSSRYALTALGQNH